MIEDMTKTRALISFTIAALGLAAAHGTMHYLSTFITFWPAVLAAAGIELAYIVLATVPSSFEDDPSGMVLGTARWLVIGSVVCNFGHAYSVAAPGALSGSGRFELLAAVQALIVAVFVPAIAFRLSQVLARVQARPEQNKDLDEAQGRLNDLALQTENLTRNLIAAQEENKVLKDRIEAMESRARRVRG